MKNLVDNYYEFPTILRKPLWRLWHNILLRFDKDATVNFMNFGYASLNGDKLIDLEKDDEKNRFCIQLYDHVVNKGILKNKRIVEIGSGRGGGAHYITRYYKPSKYTGVDISAGVIKFCNRFYNNPELSFIEGHAEKIPLPAESHDVAVNIESARCYSNIKTFFKEVHRILSPNGQFLFADVIEKGFIDKIRNDLKNCGFTIISETDITSNVIKGLELDSERREKLIHEKSPGPLKKLFEKFSGIKGSKRFESFNCGDLEYWSFVLTKKKVFI